MSFWTHKYPDIQLNKDHNILWLALDRPDARNAYSLEMISSLVSVLEKLEASDDIRCLIVTGKGRAFCAGGDIKSMSNKSEMFAGTSNELRLHYERGIQKISEAFEALSIPSIAMVNGPAIGAGCDLACMCDLRVASDKARFAETFSKLALVPGDGGAFFLQRVVGYAKAMEMFLTAKTVDAYQAHEMGLVGSVVSEEELEEEVKKIALNICSLAPQALRMTKVLMKDAYHNQLKTQLQLASAFQGIAQRMKDHEIALESIKSKQGPRFSGQ